jgi:creatinine amidohydrolase
MLHVEPEGVLGDRAVAGETRPIGELMPRLRREGVRPVSPTGVLGDPVGASAEEGKALLGELVDRLLVAVDAWDVDTTGRLRPGAVPR